MSGSDDTVYPAAASHLRAAPGTRLVFLGVSEGAQSCCDFGPDQSRPTGPCQQRFGPPRIVGELSHAQLKQVGIVLVCEGREHGSVIEPALVCLQRHHPAVVGAIQHKVVASVDGGLEPWSWRDVTDSA